MLTIKKGTPEDARHAWNLVNQTESLDGNSLYFYLVMFSFFKESSAVAYKGKELVGFICGFSPKDKSDTFFCWQIGVRDSHQGQGIAHRLLSYVMDEGFKKLECTITPSNESSHGFFNSFAKKNNMQMTKNEFYSEEHFLGTHHEREDLIQYHN